jgi:uracil phosphoribosyltransferase
MRVHVVDHPLVSHKLTALRDERTDSPTFRRLADELVTLLAYEATRDVRVEDVTVQTPVAPAHGVHLATPAPLVVPILRAGLGMLEGMVRLLPTAEVGFLGMVRNEATLEAAIRFLAVRGADHITAICLLSAPEGVQRVERDLDDLGLPITIVTAAMDEHLNDKGYIVPGLGDAGDRLYGVAH